ncbi:MAG: TIR domain-containing protein [Clostridia bacterium]|nr:TIR domain-containing protein [Clostridia bacterium]
MEHMPTAYEGKQPYIFVSYAHKDAARVLPVIESLVKSGFRVWYDAGIEAGTEWPEYIAAHLADAACVLAFLSPASINSRNCRQEITFALSRDRAMLTVFLEDVKLPLGLEMQLGLTQAMFYHRHGTVESFARELVKAEVIADCREETPSLPKNVEKPAPSAAQSSVAPAPEPAPAPAEPTPAPAPAAPALFNLKNDEMTVVDGVLERYHGQRERVEIPEGVTVIASEVFKRNAALKSIRLPRSLVTIRAWAFADCPALEEITIPGGVEVVSSNLFVGSGLKRVILS